MATEPRPFLDVATSVTGKTWVDALSAPERAQAEALVQRTGLPDTLARVLIARGVAPEAAEAYLDPKLKTLMPDPLVLADMDKAAERLIQAVDAGEAIVIFGDYDVDGATSSALLWRFLKALGVTAEIRIPDRLLDGYGPNDAAIEEIAARGGQLLVTVDCGTTSFSALDRARVLGLDTIVLDHHQAETALPEAVALVNPNRQDDLSDLGHLAAVGIVFMVLVEMSRRLRARGQADLPDLMGLLDLVALGTVADVARLRGLNRAFVRQGLRLLQAPDKSGLNALMRVARVQGPVTAYHLGFLLGPRINAGGRIGDASLGARLLTLDDPVEAEAIAQRLDELNSERQALEAGLLEDAVAQVEARGLSDQPVIVVSGAADWHPGLLGLVAARLKERYNRPAVAIGFDGARGTGSARSISGVDLGAAVRALVRDSVLVKGGGHAMAAGLTVMEAELPRLKAGLAAHLAEDVSDAVARSSTRVDGALTAAGATRDLCDLLDRAGPYGAGNPEPVFAFPAHRLSASPVKGGHIRLRLRAGDGASVSGIAFRAEQTALGDALLAGRDRPVHLLGVLRRDRYGGRDDVVVTVRDAAFPTA